MRSLSPRERRLIAIGLLLLAVGLFWFAVVGPLVSGFSSRAAERRLLQATLQRDQRVVDSLPVWRNAAVEQARSAPRFAIVAPSEQAAVDILKDRLEKVAVDQGFTLSSVQDMQAEAAPGEVKVRAVMELTLTQLYETLRRIEGEGAYVVVDFLSVNADRALVAGHSAPLAVRIELRANFVPGRDAAT